MKKDRKRKIKKNEDPREGRLWTESLGGLVWDAKDMEEEEV